MSARFLGLLSLVVITGLTANGRLSAQEPTTGGAPGETELATAPVMLDGTLLFRVRGVSSLPAEARARLIQGRLITVAADAAISTDSIRAVDVAGTTRIMAGDAPLVTLTDADANLEQIGRDDLARIHLARVRRAVADYRAARSPTAMRRSASNSALATLMLAATLAALFLLMRWVDPFLTRRLQARIHSVEIQKFEVMRAERIWQAVRGGLRALRTIAVLAVILVYLGFVLAQFPWTRPLSKDMVSFAFGPLQVMGQGLATNIPRLVFLVVLFIVVRLLLRFGRIFFDALGRGSVTHRSFDPEWAEPTYKLVRVAVVAFALIVAYPYIPGSDTAAFRGVSVFVGIVLSLGSSTAISNMIAGYLMTYRRALKVGDRVKIGNAIGDVIDVRLQVTHLRSFKNEEIIIPNSQILTSEVLNYSSLAQTHGLILHTEVGIGYETPWRQVEAMLLTAADRTEGLPAEPNPFVRQKELGTFDVTYELNVYCHDAQAMGQFYTALHRNILDVFNEYGVQIMTPAYESDPATPKVVPRKDWHAAPAARTQIPPARRGSSPARTTGITTGERTPASESRHRTG
jgi:small-conductance mechanosensitive channel